MPPETAAATAPAEPSLATLRSPLARCFFATRPAFLSVTLVGVLLGLAAAWNNAAGFELASALVTLVFALAAHAGANVLNDYYDHLNGTDAANTERVFPFTGGSRFIQNGVMAPRDVALLGYGLFAAVVPAGLWLTWQSGPQLILIGLAGLIIGWAYSAPPLALASRGMGELAIAAGWLLVVVGSDYVQRGAFTALPAVAGAGYALLVANLLYINQFPDAPADAQAGKRTLVVRLGRKRARWGYVFIATLAHLIPLAGVVAGILPRACLLGLLSAPLAVQAARGLWRHAETPSRLVPAITRTIGVAHLHGALLAVALVADRVFA